MGMQKGVAHRGGLRMPGQLRKPGQRMGLCMAWCPACGWRSQKTRPANWGCRPGALRTRKASHP